MFCFNFIIFSKTSSFTCFNNFNQADSEKMNEETLAWWRRKIHAFFISEAFFQLSLSVALLFPELNFKCCLGVTYIYNIYHTYNLHYTETHFIFSIFVSMSMLRYAISLCHIFVYLCRIVCRIFVIYLSFSASFSLSLII